jgi:putative MATE family efflux protein
MMSFHVYSFFFSFRSGFPPPILLPLPRRFKDTVTPLRAGAVANAVHLALDVALVFWLRWGVVGAALATAFSHWLTAGMLLRAAAARGRLRLADLARPPTWAAVAPVLRSGLLLSTRSVLAMSMLLWSTKLIAGFGAVALASHEILRQVWVLSNQAFTSLDIATQSLVAYHLGRGERGAAAAVFRRTLTLTAGAGVAIAAALLATHAELGALFTADAAVVAQVAGVVPLLAVYMPLDAVASVMDGVLLGSQDLAWLSRTMVVTSAVTGLALLVAARAGWGIAPIWGCIKVLTLGRLVGNGWRILSPDSPIAERPAVAR